MKRKNKIKAFVNIEGFAMFVKKNQNKLKKAVFFMKSTFCNYKKINPRWIGVIGLSQIIVKFS